MPLPSPTNPSRNRRSRTPPANAPVRGWPARRFAPGRSGPRTARSPSSPAGRDPCAPPVHVADRLRWLDASLVGRHGVSLHLEPGGPSRRPPGGRATRRRDRPRTHGWRAGREGRRATPAGHARRGGRWPSPALGPARRVVVVSIASQTCWRVGRRCGRCRSWSGAARPGRAGRVAPAHVEVAGLLAHEPSAGRPRAATRVRAAALARSGTRRPATSPGPAARAGSQGRQGGVHFLEGSWPRLVGGRGVPGAITQVRAPLSSGRLDLGPQAGGRPGCRCRLDAGAVGGSPDGHPSSRRSSDNRLSAPSHGRSRRYA
jgi:hypothetical protein